MTRGNYLFYTPFVTLSSHVFADYEVNTFRVPHGYNGFSYAFHFQRAGARWAYMPDCLGLEDLEPWRDLDLVILGTSFYKENAPFQMRSVYDVQEAMNLLTQLKPKRTVFTHLGHGIDVRKPAPRGTSYAYDGLTVELP